MTESSSANGHSSQTGADDQPSLSGLFRSWLRAALRGKSEASWRETIGELIEDTAEPATTVAAHERMLLSNILQLRDLTAIDVMVPRADIVAIDIETPLMDALRVLADRAHSRVPVYRDTLDDAVGIIHIKDVVAAVATGQERRLDDLCRPLLIIAPSMPVLDLLLEMRQKRRHMALVVDEFGGIDGLVTIEDVVEEIVGEIEDEHETEQEPQIEPKPDGSFLVDARLLVEDFEEAMGRTVVDEGERDDIDTMGGLLYSLVGRIPARGEVLRHPIGLEFEVVDADPRRIKRLRVRPTEPPAEPDTRPDP